MPDSTLSVSSEALSSDDALPPLYFLIVFWGAEFRELFCELTIASLLSPNNLPALENKRDARFLICTSVDDWEELQRDRLFQRMTEYITPEFIDIGDRYFYWKYHKMGRGHRLLTTATFEARAAAVNINPDTVVPDGSVTTVQRLLHEGKDLVLCQAVRFETEGVMADIEAGGMISDDGVINVPMRKAAEIGVRNFHSETLAGNWDSWNFGTLHKQHTVDHFPICCYFEVPGEDGVVMFGHNWAPFLMNYRSLDEHKAESFDYWTIDGVYAFENFGHAKVGEAVHVVTDSDELFPLGLTPRDEMAVKYEWRWWKGRGWFGRWNKGYMLNQVLFVKWMDKFRYDIYPIFARWHGCDVNDRWAPVERRAERIIAEYTRRNLDARQALRKAQKQGDTSALKAALEPFTPDRGLRFLWYLVWFWNGVPEHRDREDGAGRERLPESRVRLLKSRMNVGIGARYFPPKSQS